MGKTMFRKLAMAFAVGFVPVFLTGLIDVLADLAGGDVPGANAVAFLALSLVSGAAGAGLRGVLARWTDFVPGDELHSPGPPDSVRVTTEGAFPEDELGEVPYA